MNEPPIATDTSLPPPPPPPKKRGRKPRSTPPPPPPAVGSPVPPRTADPATPPPAPEELGGTLPGAQDAPPATAAPVSIDPVAAGYPTLSPVVCAPPGGGPVTIESVVASYLATEFVSAFHKGWLVVMALDLDPQALAVLARKTGVSRARLSEQRSVGLVFDRPESVVSSASFDAHMVAVKLARARLRDGAPSESVRRLAQLILREESNHLRLKRMLRDEKQGKIVVRAPVPLPEAASAESDAPPLSTKSALAEALAAVECLRTFLASAPPAEHCEQIVAAMKAVLAEARAARTVTEFAPNPDTDADLDDGEDRDNLRPARDVDFDDDDGEDDDDGDGDDDGDDGDDGDLDYEFED